MYSTSSLREHSRRNVVYYYDSSFANFIYSTHHHMKPYRVQLAHNAIQATGLLDKLDVRRPMHASFKTMARFHDEDYIRFLRTVHPDNIATNSKAEKYSICDDGDCPPFDGLYEFCALSCGGSHHAAKVLNTGDADISINWMGGLHHAKKGRASGFCYTNDIVIGILELLIVHDRVLYVDIDVHHGDGVQEAFNTTDRVMTVSFHYYHEYDFFPQSGNYDEVGYGEGRNYSVNVPFNSGIEDYQYIPMFKAVMSRVMERYDPSVIVLQCGADSLNGDTLGIFNLSVKGHGECVRFLRSFNRPLMLLGGGGYTPTIVARCWTNETAIALGAELPFEVPYDPLDDHLHADDIDNRFNYKLKKTEKNINTSKSLAHLQREVFANLDQLIHVPSVQMHPTPPNNSWNEYLDAERDAQEDANIDMTLPVTLSDRIIHHDADYYDSERAGEDRRNESNAKQANRRSKRPRN